jgi:hypothetical protein
MTFSLEDIMRRMLRIPILAGGFTFGLGAVLWAQAPGGHTHASPHGGEVVEAAKHHVEFKAEPSGTIAVWLLDAQQKAVTPPSGGKVTLMPAGGDQLTLPLKIDTEAQRLVAQFDPKKFRAFQAVVTLPIEGKRHNFRFHYPAGHR